MKICIVQGAFLPVPPVMGGAVEKVWFGLAQEFARAGHEVVHVSKRHAEFSNRETWQGVEHRRVMGYASPHTMPRRLWLDLLYSRRARAQIPHCDVVVTNTFWLPVLLGRRSAARRVYVHVARFPKGQLKLYRRADRLQTVSHAVARAMKRQEPGMAAKISVVPNPLPVDGMADSFRRNIDARCLLYVGRVHPEKGLELLIKACLRLECDYQLRIVGPWQSELGGGGLAYWKSLHDLATRAGMRIQFVGPKFGASELKLEYANAGVFVYPSLAVQGESFGLAPLEAMAQGCVPLTSDLECFEDFIHSGENGFFFRRDQGSSGLNLRLKELFAQRDLTAISHAAQNTAAEYDMASVAQMYLRDFATVTGPCN